MTTPVRSDVRRPWNAPDQVTTAATIAAPAAMHAAIAAVSPARVSAP
ncbi:hypothetical protein ACNUCX_10330 [Curtobacterium flaccumfaciens pv. flaccumfaciens]